ncbi:MULTISPECIES: 3-oxoadipate enol-lactonase [unclassified Pseudonocardia]|jgi:3-oxoadipate enol-lactonase|uniref:3-oxoadipate enol-lactonase n=1 Tax=unclassified Pseudonocardia TaxID=2619320 RepID=UPI00310122C7
MSTVVLHHEIDGPEDAPVLVLSGSLGSTLEMWEPNLPALTSRFRVVRLDHRGHGRSPVPEGPYRIADLAGDVLATLDELGLDRVAWCGLSMGGMVGMYLASEHPERISRLVLCCTSARFPDLTAWKDRIAAVAEQGTAPLAPGIVARWFTAEYAAAHPDVVKRAESWVADSSDEGYRASCQAIEAWDHVDRLPAITAPTLVIAGSADLSTPVEPHARTIASGIPGAHLEVVEGAHLATMELSEETSRLIAEHAGD